MSSTVQNIIIILGIILIASLGYYLYTQSDSISLQNGQVNNQAAAETSQFLARLNELKSITLKADIFSDPRFQSLEDSSKVVVPVPVGRSNPFTPTN